MDAGDEIGVLDCKRDTARWDTQGEEEGVVSRERCICCRREAGVETGVAERDDGAGGCWSK